MRCRSLSSMRGKRMQGSSWSRSCEQAGWERCMAGVTARPAAGACELHKIASCAGAVLQVICVRVLCACMRPQQQMGLACMGWQADEASATSAPYPAHTMTASKTRFSGQS